MFFTLLTRLLRAAVLINRTTAALGATAVIFIGVREYVARTRAATPPKPIAPPWRIEP